MHRYVFISMIAFALLASPWLAAQPQEETITFRRGDLDNDGVVTVHDVVLFDKWVLGEPVKVIEALDVNDDGVIDAADRDRMLFMTIERRAVPAERLEFIRGDADCDGLIGIQDLFFIMNWAVGISIGHAVLDASDVNRDGRIDTQDQMDIMAIIQELRRDDDRRNDHQDPMVQH